MNEFERQIRDAISAARTGVRQAEQALHTPAGQLGSSLAAVSATTRTLRGVLPAAPSARDTLAQPLSIATEPQQEESDHLPHQNSTGAPVSDPLPEQVRMDRNFLSRPGTLSGVWHNRYIAAAMPLLLLVERIRGQQSTQITSVRTHIVRELQYFQQNLLKQACLPADVDHLSYLLCTYIDGVFCNLQESNVINPSLLVEFHRDAWGGEDCFEDLQTYMQDPQPHLEILGLYDLILSLGFTGKYQMIERGPVLLADLRHRLDLLLYGQNPTQSLAAAETAKVTLRTRYIRPFTLFCCGFLLCLLAYSVSAWYLHEQSRQIRSDILAWEPPAPRKINIMETLPNPLSQILNEGWLEVREDPRGWLLIFTSDGAFRTGKAQLTAEFLQKRNIERLGSALAPWPGDLEVIGHTDSQPFRNESANTNQKLSEARAMVVADKLRETTQLNQMHAREITSIGRGESEPLADNTTEEGRRRNRRVDILWKIGQRDASQAMSEYVEREASPGDSASPMPE